jgi:hypothetical protein
LTCIASGMPADHDPKMMVDHVLVVTILLGGPSACVGSGGSSLEAILAGGAKLLAG